jgi:hypothetical protein
MTVRHHAAAVAAVCLFAASAAGQRIANAEEQAALESAVGESMLVAKESLNGYALDPRLYYLSGIGPRWTWRSPERPGVIVRPAAQETHITTLARSLGIDAVIVNSRACSEPLPARCRLGSFDRVAAFGTAVVAGDSAQIVLFRWHQTPASEPWSASGVFTYFQFTRVEATWRLAKRASSNVN